MKYVNSYDFIQSDKSRRGHKADLHYPSDRAALRRAEECKEYIQRFAELCPQWDIQVCKNRKDMFTIVSSKDTSPCYVMETCVGLLTEVIVGENKVSVFRYYGYEDAC